MLLLLLVNLFCQVLSNAKLNEDFFTVSVPLGFQLPVLLDNDVFNFPG